MSVNKRVVFKQPDGTVSYLVPAPNCLKKYTIEEIAAKDVPAGRPYKIIDVSELPQDPMWRDAWEIDDAELTDGVGAESDEFPEIR
jgi:hypothetical protein